MTSESYITKLYFKKYFLILFPIAVLISTIGFILCFFVFQDNTTLCIPTNIITTLSIIISIAVPALLAYTDKIKGKKAFEIFRTEGFTCKFCDAYRKIYIDKGNPFPLHVIMCASYYGKISEHDTARILLNKIRNPKKLDSYSRFMYYLEMLSMCGKTGNWCKGEEVRKKNIGFLQNYVRKHKNNPELRVNMDIALALIDSAHGHYGDAFTLLNSGYKPKDKNDENFLNILINAVYIYSLAKNDDNLSTAIINAETFLKNFTAFDFPWCKKYYEEQIIRASQGKL